MEKKVPPPQPKKGLSPATLTMLVLVGCFFLSLIMVSGALQFVLAILCLVSITGFGIYQAKQKRE